MMTSLDVTIIPVTPFQQNCALIQCTKTRNSFLIDPGGEPDLIMNAVKASDHKIQAIILTHGHIDHVGAAVDLAAHYDIPIWGPHRDDEVLLQALPMQSHMFGVADIKVPKPDRWLEEGDVLECGDLRFDIYHCPGHAPGHIVLHAKAEKFGIFGDVLFRHSIGRTDLPGGNHQALLTSIRDKILPLGDDVRFICGHGSDSTIGHERLNNPFLVK